MTMKCKSEGPEMVWGVWEEASCRDAGWIKEARRGWCKGEFYLQSVPVGQWILYSWVHTHIGTKNILIYLHSTSDSVQNRPNWHSPSAIAWPVLLTKQQLFVERMSECWINRHCLVPQWPPTDHLLMQSIQKLDRRQVCIPNSLLRNAREQVPLAVRPREQDGF